MPVCGSALHRFDRGRAAGKAVGKPDIGPADQGMAKRHAEAQIEGSQSVHRFRGAAPREVGSCGRQQHRVQQRNTGQQHQPQSLLMQQIPGAEARGEQHPEADFAADDEIYQNVHDTS